MGNDDWEKGVAGPVCWRTDVLVIVCKRLENGRPAPRLGPRCQMRRCLSGGCQEDNDNLNESRALRIEDREVNVRKKRE